jgi:excisionase family DNA binding protein
MPDDPAPLTHLRGFNLNNAAERLNMPVTSLRARVRSGSVRAVRIGQRYYVPAAELERLLTPVDGLTPQRNGA